MRSTTLVLVTVTVAVALAATPAAAYIGPGLGAGAIAIVLGILGSIVLAFVAIVWYPLKRLVKSRRKAKVGPAAPASTPAERETGADKPRAG